MRIRRALLTASDKIGIVELARALADAGAELVATGRTASQLTEAGLPVTPIEKITGSPEAFQGRMKTLSFQALSGILYRRGDASDEADLKRLGVVPIDCVVVNFYPFEQAAARPGIKRSELIEEIDIGGPTLVRAAAKNSPDVLVLTSPTQYGQVIASLRDHGNGSEVPESFAMACAETAWRRVLEYDRAIADTLASKSTGELKLRYGENPHQKGLLRISPDSPIAWPNSPAENLTATELSYNNILDLSGAYSLARDLVALDPGSTGVVIVKHNNPCGVALVAEGAGAQLKALEYAWAVDPVSAFGGVLIFTRSLDPDCAAFLASRFVELVAAPGLSRDNPELKLLINKRKNLKAVAIRTFESSTRLQETTVVGGVLAQDADTGFAGEELRVVSRKSWSRSTKITQFGIAVGRSLKSNAITLVRELDGGRACQLVGAGQGQPNRIDALERLAIPRARDVLKAGPEVGSIGDCVMVSDAFFPFRDTVDAAAQAGITAIVQPGGSLKDSESIAACDEHGIAMVFTGRRHFRH